MLQFLAASIGHLLWYCKVLGPEVLAVVSSILSTLLTGIWAVLQFLAASIGHLLWSCKVLCSEVFSTAFVFTISKLRSWSLLICGILLVFYLYARHAKCGGKAKDTTNCLYIHIAGHLTFSCAKAKTRAHMRAHYMVQEPVLTVLPANCITKSLYLFIQTKQLKYSYIMKFILWLLFKRKWIYRKCFDFHLSKFDSFTGAHACKATSFIAQIKLCDFGGSSSIVSCPKKIKCSLKAVVTISCKIWKLQRSLCKRHSRSRKLGNFSHY